MYNKEKGQLLQSLRSTVEGLLMDGLSNVWDVYGGLNRLHNVMEQIFKHGCRIFDPNVSCSCSQSSLGEDVSCDATLENYIIILINLNDYAHLVSISSKILAKIRRLFRNGKYFC